MKTRTSYACVVAAILGAMPLFAQDNFVMDKEDEPTTVVRVDHVGADLITPTAEGRPGSFARITETGTNGLYRTRILSPQRIKRMEGSYVDAELTIPHGLFIYYHPNGRIESAGEYHQGVKVGVWYLQDITGKGRAERVYTGLDQEDLLVAAGVSERAHTIGPR